jgi:hypothetical protein
VRSGFVTDPVPYSPRNTPRSAGCRTYEISPQVTGCTIRCQGLDRLAACRAAASILESSPYGEAMARLRDLIRTSTAVVLSFGLLFTCISNAPASNAATVAFGTVVSADRARVGTAKATVGTTVLSGDTLDTDKFGSIQVRAGAARLLLTSLSQVTWANEESGASATLKNGTAIFSTANSKAFALHAGTALIRPNSDAATVGSVTILSPKELTVSCSHGALAISVEDDTKVVAEGTAYRVVLDPDDAQAQNTDNPPPVFQQKAPRKSGRDRFLMFILIFAGVGTGLGIYFALESPDRP